MSVSEWKEVRLGDVILFNPSESLKKGKIAKKITMEQLAPFTRKITNYELSEFTGGSKFRNGDTLLARITPCLENGKTAYVDILSNSEVAFGSTEFIVMRNKENITDDKFIYYLAISPDFRDKAIKSMTGTSGRQRVQQDVLQSYKIILPPLPEQKAIAAILSALDDMIELNNQINKTLEEMAQAIFKSWFVDFEPFKDGEFEESELGLIPKGWRVGTLSSIGDIIGGGTPSKSKPEYYADSGIPWITPKDLSMNKNKYISRGQFDISELGLRESSAKLMPKGTVLFSSRAPIGYIAIAKNAVTTNQGFKSIVPFNNISSEYVYLLLKNNIGEIESRASGSTFKEISGGEMKKVPIILPPMDVINQFNEIATTLGKVQALLEDENNILSSIRDTLLPKLMSGEIRVPVEEVV
ncbi:restriction endonuclease subunit S [Paradesulfitobacterium ferrireducens]|uniref:restriction endonuclease subunit S n=1 Tax=Paradesulfitobacterium ferrireducens TaxID=2816476 RepID=UPI001A901D8D|nr:restriction endonuclease subunit S [Paradesulfitobacterium ferrireducens]